jgi:drug/metabolite transporter (DMT)-like permease
MLLLCLIWGFQQIAIKSVAAEIAPVMQLAIRFAGATVFFGVWVLVQEGWAAFRDGTLPSGLLLGTLFALEFIFAGQSLLHTTAAHSVVFLYSAPIFTALGLQFLPEEHLKRGQWAGIGLAFLGISIAFLDSTGRRGSDWIVGDLYALIGGASWGLSNVVLRRGRVGGGAAFKTVLYQLGVASVVLGSFAAATGQIQVHLSVRVVASLLFQTLVIAIFSYMLWFGLLRRYLTSRLMLMSLFTPVFGVLFAAALLKEPLDARFGVGALLVIAGVLVVHFAAPTAVAAPNVP